MKRLNAKSDYEEVRTTRISENQARLASLGLKKTMSELRSLISSPKSVKKKICKVDYSSSPLRRSARFSGKSASPQGGDSVKEQTERENNFVNEDNKPKRPPCAFFVFMEEFRMQYKEMHPENKSVGIVGKAAGDKWKSMNEEERALFVAKAEKRKEEHERKMEAYKKKMAGGGDDESDNSNSEVNDGEPSGEDNPKSDYEELRNAPIFENQARLASLGLQKRMSGLRRLISSPKPEKVKSCRVDYSSSPLRRSARFSEKSVSPQGEESKDDSKTRKGRLAVRKQIEEDNKPKRPPSAFFVFMEEFRIKYKKKHPENKSVGKASGEKWKSLSEMEKAPYVAKAEKRKERYEWKMEAYNRKMAGGADDESDKSNLEEEDDAKSDYEPDESNSEVNDEEDSGVEKEDNANSYYEELRNARISENQARLASLGLQKTISELRSVTSSPKFSKRKLCKVDYSSTTLRRSARMIEQSPSSQGECGDSSEKGKESGCLVRTKKGLRRSHISMEMLARRCDSKGRGSLYNPVGISCHFCRQKKLCGEEDCKRCSNLDMDQPCIGKTDCSICHSSNGILCRACLKVRYGEEMEEVRANKEWICPHCTEDKGINPYWICNSSICLNKRKMVPTGIAIYRAREKGYKSVAHLVMDELQRADKRKKST